MGLDMYLYKEKFFGECFNKEDRPKVTGFNKCESITVRGQILYWRKANAIHKWFVDNVQKGNDDCKDYYVEKEQLKELLDLVNKALKNHTKAPEILPVEGGFFFGCTKYDEWYFKNLEETKKGLEEILKDKTIDGYDLYYKSSW